LGGRKEPLLDRRTRKKNASAGKQEKRVKTRGKNPGDKAWNRSERLKIGGRGDEKRWGCEEMAKRGGKGGEERRWGRIRLRRGVAGGTLWRSDYRLMSDGKGGDSPRDLSAQGKAISLQKY